jgi:uncharacterized phage protein gp47/JayE
MEFNEELGMKTYDEIVDSTLQGLIDKNVGITAANDGSVIRSLVEVLAEEEDTTNYFIEYVYRVMNINNCRGEDLDRAAVIFGMTRTPAKPAVAEVTFYTGDEPAKNDIEIPYGYIVSTRPDYNGDVYEFEVTDAQAILKAGEMSITCTVQCTTPGLININAGAICILPESLQGIDSVSNDLDINGGTDTETDEEFLERIQNIKETQGKCTDAAIESAINAINGVTKCSVKSLYAGNGTTGIIIVTDQVPAPQSVIDDITKTVNEFRASGVRPILVFTDTKFIDINITIDVDSSKYATISNVITKYCNSLTSGQSFIINQMERKILNALDTTSADNDDLDIITNYPKANVTATDEQIIRADSIIINGTKVL